MNKAQPIFFKNYGFLKKVFTDQELAPLKAEIDIIKKDFENAKKCNFDLAGNMEQEYFLIDSKKYVENLLLPLVAEYDHYFNFSQSMDFLTQGVPIQLDKLWVNFQKKNEFNPNHRHSGFMSFVIYIKIPYTQKGENEMSPGKEANKNCSGQFEFQYTNALGDVSYHNVAVDDLQENMLLLFPAKLSHCVYPFYSSDDYRISVSGNYKFKTD